MRIRTFKVGSYVVSIDFLLERICIRKFKRGRCVFKRTFY